MKRIRLGVNIDHVATVRNARGEIYPSPLRAALLAEKNGADSVTIHLREDRRHINEFDLKKIIKKLKIPLNLEIASTKEMLKIAYRSRPPFICIVPEKRKEITTEGGLNLDHNKNFLRTLIKKLKKNNSLGPGLVLGKDDYENLIVTCRDYYCKITKILHFGKIIKLSDLNL